MTFVVQIKVEVVDRETGLVVTRDGTPYKGDPTIDGGPIHVCELAGIYEDQAKAINRFHQLTNIVRPLGRLQS